MSYGYKKELELPINNYKNDISFIGSSKWSLVHNRVEKVYNWLNELSENNKVKLYGNWEEYKKYFHENIEIFGKVSMMENLRILNLSKATLHIYLDYYKKNKQIVIGNRIYDATHAGTCIFFTDKESIPSYLSEFKEFVVKDSKELNKLLNNMTNSTREQQILFQRQILQKYTPEFEFNKFLKYKI